jgi:hypothetical protein
MTIVLYQESLTQCTKLTEHAQRVETMPFAMLAKWQCQKDTMHTNRGCTGDFPTRKSKKTSWVLCTQKIETKKTSKPSQQNNLGQPPNCLFLILTMATKMHAGVNIMQCCNCILPTLVM